MKTKDGRAPCAPGTSNAPSTAELRALNASISLWRTATAPELLGTPRARARLPRAPCRTDRCGGGVGHAAETAHEGGPTARALLVPQGPWTNDSLRVLLMAHTQATCETCAVLTRRKGTRSPWPWSAERTPCAAKNTRPRDHRGSRCEAGNEVAAAAAGARRKLGQRSV